MRFNLYNDPKLSELAFTAQVFPLYYFKMELCLIYLNLYYETVCAYCKL